MGPLHLRICNEETSLCFTVAVQRRGNINSATTLEIPHLSECRRVRSSRPLVIWNMPLPGTTRLWQDFPRNALVSERQQRLECAWTFFWHCSLITIFPLHLYVVQTLQAKRWIVILNCHFGTSNTKLFSSYICIYLRVYIYIRVKWTTRA